MGSLININVFDTLIKLYILVIYFCTQLKLRNNIIYYLFKYVIFGTGSNTVLYSKIKVLDILYKSENCTQKSIRDI